MEWNEKLRTEERAFREEKHTHRQGTTNFIFNVNMEMGVLSYFR